MKVGIIHNPAAGSANRLSRMGRLVQQLTLQGHVVMVFGTRHPGDATDLTRQAVEEGCDVVVAVGGDGTLNEVMQGLVGSKVALASYPAGTTNVWCREIKMPLNPRRAATVISTGQRRMVDVGQANDQYFLLMTGIGLDAEVVQKVDLDLKKRLGKLAYLFAILQTWQFDGARFNITLNANEGDSLKLSTHASMIIVSNSRRYATVVLAREAQIDDGKLEVMVFKGSKWWSKLGQVFSVMTNRIEHNSKIGYFRVHTANIATASPVATQLDGDILAGTEDHNLAIRCIPSALQVVVPFQAPGKLFSH